MLRIRKDGFVPNQSRDLREKDEKLKTDYRIVKTCPITIAIYSCTIWTN